MHLMLFDMVYVLRFQEEEVPGGEIPHIQRQEKDTGKLLACGRHALSPLAAQNTRVIVYFTDIAA